MLHVEHGRVKLHELHVGDPCARAKCQRHAVTAGHLRVRRLAKHLTGAARREQRGARERASRLSLRVDELHAGAASISDNRRGGQRVFEHANARPCRRALPQHAANLAAGRVAGVQHTAHAVGAFGGERRPAVGIDVEASAPLDELERVARTFLGQHPHRSLIAQSVARHRGIAGVQGGRIVRTNRRGDAALRVFRIAFARIGLRDDHDIAGGRQLNRRAQARDAAADDDEVAAKIHDAMLLHHYSDK